MTGIKEDELYDHLMNNHEIEFTYSNSTFIIQPEARESGNYLTIWSLGETSDLVCEVKNDIRITNIF